MKQSHKTLLLWIFLILMFLAVYNVFTNSQNARPVPFSEFIADVRANHVTWVQIKDRDVTYQRRATPASPPEERATTGPINEWQLQNELIQHNIEVRNEKEDNNGFLTTLLVSWLPMLFLLGMFMFFMRQLQAGGGKAMSFGKSRARLVNDANNKVTFADVAGIDEAKDEVEEIIAFLKDPKKFRRLGGRIPKGVLLMGSPGTGKTLLARAIAGEAGVPFFSISGLGLRRDVRGRGREPRARPVRAGEKARAVHYLHRRDRRGWSSPRRGHGRRARRARANAQSASRGDGRVRCERWGDHRRGHEPTPMVALDPAILRPGRFDRRITVPRPGRAGREQILRVHTRKVPLSPDVDLDVIARATPGFAGADLENLVNEAALLAARQDKDSVSMNDIELAKDKVLMGVERKHMVISEKEKRMTAWHEAGHTLVGLTVVGNDPVHKVTIIPRGPALGLTMNLPVEDRYTHSKSQLLAMISMMMGGRVAEDVVFGVRSRRGLGATFGERRSLRG